MRGAYNLGRKVEIVQHESGQMVARIPLPNGKFGIVDAGDLDLVKHWNWSMNHRGFIVRTDRQTRKSISLHILINNPPPPLKTAHLNGIKSDNRRCNLSTVKRTVTPALIAAAKLNGRLGGKPAFTPRAVEFVSLPNNEWAARIPLTRGEFALVDIEDLDKVANHRWCCNAWGYAVRSEKKNGVRVNYLMHRVINNTPENCETDHVNCDRLDNRKSNLRSCNRTENQCNVRIKRNNQSGFKGVWFNKNEQKYCSSVTLEGKTVWLGYFVDPEEAHRKYADTVNRLHGEFARPQ